MRDELGHYLAQIAREPLLTQEAEHELARAIEAGRDAGDPGRRRAAERARSRFLRANLRLVVSIARTYPRPPGMELLDLVQEGTIGLARAVDRFDWRRGFRFSTYATDWIHQAVGRAVNRNSSAVTVSPDLVAELRAAVRRGDELPLRLRTIDAALSVVELDGPAHGSETPLSTWLPAGDSVEDDALTLLERDEVRLAVRRLPPDVRRVVELRYGLLDGSPRTVRAVALVAGLPPARVSQLHAKGIESLRARVATLGIAG